MGQLMSRKSDGLATTANPASPDYVIINTCGFIQAALNETKRVIRQTRRRYPAARLIVFGCGVNRASQQLKNEFPDINDWFRIDERSRMINLLFPSARSAEKRHVTTRGYAFLKIAEGCSNNCAYCTIPLIRGPLRSRSWSDIMAEAYGLIRAGVRELILVAQDTTAYGIDRYRRPMLIPLIRRLSRLPGLHWIRLMYAHPKSLTPETIHDLAGLPRLCRYLDMPIQHVNDRLLKLMNRRTTRRHLEALIKSLRRHRFTFRTTIMTGFPTESESEHRELIDFLAACQPDWLGVFHYSREADTPAYNLKPLPSKVVRRRFKQLTTLQQTLLKIKNRQRLGRCCDVLINSQNHRLIGHAEFTAPEIDSRILLKKTEALVGSLCRARITGMMGADLCAQVISSPAAPDE